LLYGMVVAAVIAFIAYQAATNDVPKFPVLGDLAMKWAERSSGPAPPARPTTTGDYDWGSRG
jgi:hypothetical protein